MEKKAHMKPKKEKEKKRDRKNRARNLSCMHALITPCVKISAWWCQDTMRRGENNSKGRRVEGVEL